jgi:Uma2 family endonuclease
MASTTTRLTIEDFERLPDEEARGHEPRRLAIRDALIELLRPVVRRQRLGRVFSGLAYDFDGNVLNPDVTFFWIGKVSLLNTEQRVQDFVPDFAIDVVSSDDTFNSIVLKKERYRRCGTLEVWLISPGERSVYVYSDDRRAILAGNDELSTPLIPGFSITVEDLFNGA